MDKNIVLVHGWGASVDKLVTLEDELKKLGWNTHSIKLPGFDLPDPQKPWVLKDYANLVFEKSKEKFGGSKYYIFGHSFGGRVAIKMASNEKMNKSLNGVVLCSTGGISRGNILKRKVFYIIAKLGKVLLIVPGLASFFQSILYRIVREHDYVESKGVMKKTMVNIIEEDVKSAAPAIEFPTLIMWGDLDPVTPVKDALYLERVIDGSILKIYEGKTHNLPYVEPKKLANDIDSWVNRSLN